MKTILTALFLALAVLSFAVTTNRTTIISNGIYGQNIGSNGQLVVKGVIVFADNTTMTTAATGGSTYYAGYGLTLNGGTFSLNTGVVTNICNSFGFLTDITLTINGTTLHNGSSLTVGGGTGIITVNYGIATGGGTLTVSGSTLTYHAADLSGLATTGTVGSLTTRTSTLEGRTNTWNDALTKTVFYGLQLDQVGNVLDQPIYRPTSEPGTDSSAPYIVITGIDDSKQRGTYPIAHPVNGVYEYGRHGLWRLGQTEVGWRLQEYSVGGEGLDRAFDMANTNLFSGDPWINGDMQVVYPTIRSYDTMELVTGTGLVVSNALHANSATIANSATTAYGGWPTSWPWSAITNQPTYIASAGTAATATNALQLGGVSASGYLRTTGGTISGDLTIAGTANYTTYQQTTIDNGTNYVATTRYTTNYEYVVVATNSVTTNTVNTLINVGGSINTTNGNFYSKHITDLYNGNLTAHGTFDWSGASWVNPPTNGWSFGSPIDWSANPSNSLFLAKSITNGAATYTSPNGMIVSNGLIYGAASGTNITVGSSYTQLTGYPYLPTNGNGSALTGITASQVGALATGYHDETKAASNNTIKVVLNSVTNSVVVGVGGVIDLGSLATVTGTVANASYANGAGTASFSAVSGSTSNLLQGIDAGSITSGTLPMGRLTVDTNTVGSAYYIKADGTRGITNNLPLVTVGSASAWLAPHGTWTNTGWLAVSSTNFSGAVTVTPPASVTNALFARMRLRNGIAINSTLRTLWVQVNNIVGSSYYSGVLRFAGGAAPTMIDGGTFSTSFSVISCPPTNVTPSFVSMEGAIGWTPPDSTSNLYLRVESTGQADSGAKYNYLGNVTVSGVTNPVTFQFFPSGNSISNALQYLIEWVIP